MRTLTITINATSQLTDYEIEQQVRPFLTRICYPALTVTFVTIETVAVDPYTRITDRIAAQKEWINSCGGDKAGYINNYGSVNDPMYSGSGGEAIYDADMNELARLESLRLGHVDPEVRAALRNRS